LLARSSLTALATPVDASEGAGAEPLLKTTHQSITKTGSITRLELQAWRGVE
jgi:hypothetical protein